jgi:hypothetical protein
MNLNRAPEVLAMADALHLPSSARPVDDILAFCQERIAGWLRGRRNMPSMAELEALVCAKLHLVIEEFETEEELKAIVQKYCAMGEYAFATLADDFDDKTYATLVERIKPTRHSKDRYVAVVDCRGPKGSRRFFTRWHEIAHLLTLYRQLELPFHRSRGDHTALERLMDKIAGDIGFYDPVLRPVLNNEMVRAHGLTFEVVENVRHQAFPHASFQSALKACVARANRPVVYVEASLALKKNERALLANEQTDILPRVLPREKLRAVVVMPNAIAHGLIEIHQNMEVPPSSIIYRTFFGDEALGEASELLGQENLRDWKHSDGSSLADQAVIVHARRFPGGVYALVRPVYSGKPALG